MRSVIAMLLGLSAMSPSLAFENLLPFTPLMAATQTDVVFNYMAPPLGFGATRAADYPMPTDLALGRALFSSRALDPLTGLDFRQAYGLLSIGEGLDTANIVFGRPLFTDRLAETLIGRGFEQVKLAGTTVYARGEDSTMDLSLVKEPDPFAGDRGRSERIAVIDDLVVATANWPVMEGALAGLSSASEADAWAATLLALNETMAGGRLEAAWGWNDTAFVPGELDYTTADINFPPFPSAVFAVDRLNTTTNLRIALPYEDERDARLAADYISYHLVTIPHVPDTPTTSIVKSGKWSVAVLSLTYEPDGSNRALALMKDWIALAWKRRFSPLQSWY